MFTFFPWKKEELQNPGYIPAVDPSAAQHELIFGTADPIPSNIEMVSHLNAMPPIQKQGSRPYCVSYTCAHLEGYDNKKNGTFVPLAPDYLAYLSNTGYQGNTVQAVVDTVRKIGIPELADAPAFPPTYDPLQDPPATLSNEAVVRAKDHTFLGAAYLNTNDRNELKSAIVKAPIGLTFGLDGTFGSRTLGGVLKPIKTPYVYHSVTAVGFDEKGIQVFDSLRVDWYYLDWEYELTSAYVPKQLPDNWKEVQKQDIAILAQNNANRYGKVANPQGEIHAASLLLSAFQAFKNQSVLEAAGKFWLIYVRALTYGDYSTTDLVNNTYNWRRTGRHIFDLDRPRR